MKTDTQVSKSDNNLRELKLAKDLIYLVISDLFKDEGPYTVENNETGLCFLFYRLKRGDSRTIPSFVADQNPRKILSTCLV